MCASLGEYLSPFLLRREQQIGESFELFLSLLWCFQGDVVQQKARDGHCCWDLVYWTGFGNSFLYYSPPLPRPGGAAWVREGIVCLPCVMFLKLPASWPWNRLFQIKRNVLSSLLAHPIDTWPLKLQMEFGVQTGDGAYIWGPLDGADNNS